MMFRIQALVICGLCAAAFHIDAVDFRGYLGGSAGYSDLDQNDIVLFANTGLFPAAATRPPVGDVPDGTVFLPVTAAGPFFTTAASFGPGILPFNGSLTGKVDDKDRGWKIYGGIKVNRYFGLEAAYVDAGSAEAKADRTQNLSSTTQIITTSHARASLQGVQFAAVARYPVHDHIDLFGRLGGYYWKIDSQIESTLVSNSSSIFPPDSTISSIIKFDNDGLDLVFGAGVEYSLNESISIRAEWERISGISAEKSNVDMFSIGVNYGFDFNP